MTPLMGSWGVPRVPRPVDPVHPSISVRSWPLQLKVGDVGIVELTLNVPPSKHVTTAKLLLNDVEMAVIKGSNLDSLGGIVFKPKTPGNYKLVIEIAADDGTGDRTGVNRQVKVNP